MKLPFMKRKLSIEQLEREAGEELEAAVARAKPPSEAERTWVQAESPGDWRARAATLAEEPAPSPPAPPRNRPRQPLLGSAEDASRADQETGSDGTALDDLRNELWSEDPAAEGQPATARSDSPPAPAPAGVRASKSGSRPRPATKRASTSVPRTSKAPAARAAAAPARSAGAPVAGAAKKRSATTKKAGAPASSRRTPPGAGKRSV